MGMNGNAIEKIGRELERFRYGDAIVTKSRFTSINLKDGAVESVEEGETEYISCRVLLKGSFGFASSNKLERYRETIKEAEKLAKIKGGNVKLAEPEGNRRKLKTAFKENPQEIDFEKKIKMLQEFEKLGRSGRVSNSQIGYYDAISNIVILNSRGAEIEEREVRTAAGASFFAKKGGEIQSSFDQVKEKSGFEIMKKFPEKVEKASKEANALLKAERAKGGKMTAVLDHELAGVLAHEAVGHACEADGIANESSCLQGLMGKRIGSELVTIKDSPIIEGKLWGAYEFDDEGTKAKGTILVNRGVLNGYLTSLENANEYGGRLTGNGRADTHSRQIVRMSNTYFEKGDAEIEELFEGVEKGVYLVGVKEGQVSPKVGNFTFAAKYGFLIENGEKRQMIKNVSINGNILKSLQHIDMVANDLEFLPGTCGKDGQSAPVTTGSPHLRINEILVG